MPEQVELNLNWSNEKAEESLKVLFNKAMGIATEAISWYSNSKRSKKYWAQTIRVSAIILAAVAALLPTIGDMLVNSGISKIPSG